jgi:trk system potassium uptake protein TrkA
VKVVIVGMGDIGKQLVEELSRGGRNELVLIDRDEKRCEQLASEQDALVLQGDGTDPEILRKAGLSEADALVATTDSDAINTVIAMLGHQLKVDKIIVKLNGVGLRAACQEFGVSKIIAPTITAASEIVATLFGFSRLDFSLVSSGGLRLVELGAGKAAGKRLSEIDIPEGAQIVAVLRGDQANVPRAREKLEEEDVLIVLVESDSVLGKVKKALEA